MENSWIDAVAVSDWLDKRFDDLDELRSTDDFSSHIRAAMTPDYIQITSGIDTVADILGAKLEEDGRVDEYIRYLFRYKGRKVYGLSKERLVRE